MNQDSDFNALEAEQNVINALIDKGVSFDVPRISLLKYLSKSRKRTFTIFELFTGTNDYLTDQFIKLELNEENLKSNQAREVNRAIKANTWTLSKIIAIAWLNNKWKIKLLTPFVARYFYWRVKPSKLKEVTMIIRYMMNAADFIGSIRLMLGVKRVTLPKADLIEEKQKA